MTLADDNVLLLCNLGSYGAFLSKTWHKQVEWVTIFFYLLDMFPNFLAHFQLWYKISAFFVIPFKILLFLILFLAQVLKSWTLSTADHKNNYWIWFSYFHLLIESLIFLWVFFLLSSYTWENTCMHLCCNNTRIQYVNKYMYICKYHVYEYIHICLSDIHIYTYRTWLLTMLSLWL